MAISLPGWDSLEAVTSIHHWLELAGIGFLALLVIAEAFAYVYGNRRDVLVALAAQSAEQQRQSDVSSLQRQLAQSEQTAERRIEELKLKSAGRRLTEEQKHALATSLAGFRGQKIAITCILGDTEGKQFAEDFVAMFRGIGWNDGGGTGINQAVFDRDPPGIVVAVNSEDVGTGKLPHAVGPLVNALAAAGLVSAQFQNQQVASGTIGLTVGRKP